MSKSIKEIIGRKTGKGNGIPQAHLDRARGTKAAPKKAPTPPVDTPDDDDGIPIPDDEGLEKLTGDPTRIGAYALIRSTTRRGDPARDRAWSVFLEGATPEAIIAAGNPDAAQAMTERGITAAELIRRYRSITPAERSVITARNVDPLFYALGQGGK